MTRKATAWWKSRVGGGGRLALQARTPVGVYRGGCAGPPLLASFDKDPGGSHDVESFTTEHVTKQDQEGPRGVRGHRLQKTAPLRPALLTRVRLLCSARGPGTAVPGDVCPSPLHLLCYVHTSSVPAPWVNLRFIKHASPANPLCFIGSLQISRRHLLV